MAISIHALHEESDYHIDQIIPHIGFQSTLSMRRATFVGAIVIEHRLISIHALHEERDPPVPMLATRPCHFNPRSP